uniref:Thioredoxin domain-containing protein n=1 Tax=viral metagenome TaxID=1070528 RepID=A0A6C0L1K0_9ZZZZ|tara:strand:- start:6789 stop:7289 length:501 start_codon:yes stop_codon:yes gene_type:complete
MAKSNLKTLTKMMSLNKLQKKIMFLMKPKNMYKVVILLAVLGILYFIRQRFLAKEGFASTAEEFEEAIVGKKALVLFHAEWCGHCKKFMPEWDEISTEVEAKSQDVILLKVECGDPAKNEKHDEIMKKYAIKGYPTILSFDESGKHTEYDGERSKQGILKFLGLSA